MEVKMVGNNYSPPWLLTYRIMAVTYWLVIGLLPITTATLGTGEEAYWSIGGIASALDFWPIFHPGALIIYSFMASLFVNSEFDFSFWEKMRDWIELLCSVCLYVSLAMAAIVVFTSIFAEGTVMTMVNNAYLEALDWETFFQYVHGTDEGKLMLDRYADEQSDIWAFSVVFILTLTVGLWLVYQKADYRL